MLMNKTSGSPARPRLPRRRLSAFLVLVVFCSASSGFTATSASNDEFIEDAATTVEETIVWGRKQQQKGTAFSASEGLVGYEDFKVRPIQRIGELAEVIPGMVATQHSGEGKANQYFLRGMNLDHGTDFSVYFEGMPLNLRSHAHGQGYLDLNFMIPETIATVAYAKGPYRADRGDFSSAGTMAIELDEMLDQPFVKLTTGEDGYRRLAAVMTRPKTDDKLLTAFEITTDDGPWQTPNDMQKINLMSQWSKRRSNAFFEATLLAYDNEWSATDQVPQRLINSGSLSRFATLDPQLGGETQRLALIFQFETDNLAGSAYMSSYKLDLFSNFTYFADDPSAGDQFEQVDDRLIAGGALRYDWQFGDNWNAAAGGDLRYDHVRQADLYRTRARQRTTPIRQDQVQWLSASAWAQMSFQPMPSVRVTAGLRFDGSDFVVDARTVANSGSGRDTVALPKFAIAYALNETVEIYYSHGEGFHSNDVRGVAATIDPMTGEEVDAVPLYAKQRGQELGIRIEDWKDWIITFTAFELKSDSELTFVGDAGNTEPAPGSRRYGLETALTWSPAQFWIFDINAAFVRSRYTDVTFSERYVPNAQDNVASAGIEYANDGGGLSMGARCRHFGDTPLIEDNSVRGKSATLCNLLTTYTVDAWQVSLEMINVFNREAADIAYWYGSRTDSETEVVEDIHIHPVVPRTLRLGVRYAF